MSIYHPIVDPPPEPPTCDECAQPLEVIVDADEEGAYAYTVCHNRDCSLSDIPEDEKGVRLDE
jgi:hypothetical protein